MAMRSERPRAAAAAVLVCGALLAVGCSPFDRAVRSRLRGAGLSPAEDAAVDVATRMPTKVVHEASGAMLVLIPAGEFLMGASAAEAGKEGEVQHRRTIRKPFYLGATEVTQAQWRAVMGSNPSRFQGDDLLPVEQVSWSDCQEFLQKAGGGLRLPSEAEWEYACRAGATTPFSFGATITPEQANYNGNFPYGEARPGLYREKTVPAGSLPGNAWGLHEMHGNVWEWCADGAAAYPASGTEEPAAAAGARRMRGGGWGSNANYCRAAFRDSGGPGFRNSLLGLRLASSLPE